MSALGAAALIAVAGFPTQYEYARHADSQREGGGALPCALGAAGEPGALEACEPGYADALARRCVRDQAETLAAAVADAALKARPLVILRVDDYRGLSVHWDGVPRSASGRPIPLSTLSWAGGPRPELLMKVSVIRAAGKDLCRRLDAQESSRALARALGGPAPLSASR